MKRSKFIVTMLAAAATPLVSFPRIIDRAEPIQEGFVVNAGESRYHGHIQLKGVNSNIIDVKISGKDTGGALAVFEQTSISQGRGTPLHIHHFQDEIFQVLEGEYYFQVGSKKHHLRVGDSIFLPRTVPHAWTQVAEKGKMTVILQPAGKLEEFFVTMASLKQEPSPEDIARIFSENDMQVVGPPLKIE